MRRFIDVSGLPAVTTSSQASRITEQELHGTDVYANYYFQQTSK